EIHGPDQVGSFWHGQRIGLVPLQALAWLDPEVQLQLAVDAVYALVVPAMSPDIAQVKKAQAEAPGLLRPRQPDEEIGDLLVIIVQLGAITIAGLADTKGAAGERDAHPTQRHCFPGHLSALRWPCHFFPRASLSNSACMLISAYIFFNRRFSSSRDFIWLIIEASMPPYLARHL